MTEATGEPSNTDLLAAIQELIVHVDQRFGAVETSLGSIVSSVAQLRDEVEEGFVLVNTAIVETRRDLAQVREEVLGVKIEVAAAERRATVAAQRQMARHNQNPGAHGTAA